MKRFLAFSTIALISLGAASAQADVMITEIMYNPAGPDGLAAPAPVGEWVEIYNSGSAPVDISGWYLDDEDAAPWSPLPAGSTLLAGEAAILCTNPTEFGQAWGAGIKTFGVTWGSLANSGSASNEILVLVDASNNIVDTANYEAGSNGWPISSNGKSIYLLSTALDNNVGSNWGLSAVGVDGAYSPSATIDPYNIADVGSPGIVVVPEPTSLALALMGVLGLAFRNRKA